MLAHKRPRLAQNVSNFLYRISSIRILCEVKCALKYPNDLLQSVRSYFISENIDDEHNGNDSSTDYIPIEEFPSDDSDSGGMNRRTQSPQRSSSCSSTSSTALVSVDTIETNNTQTAQGSERKLQIDFQLYFQRTIE